MVLTVHWVSPHYGGDGSFIVIYNDGALFIAAICLIPSGIGVLFSSQLSRMHPNTTAAIPALVSVLISVGGSFLIAVMVMSITNQ